MVLLNERVRHDEKINGGRWTCGMIVDQSLAVSGGGAGRVSGLAFALSGVKHWAATGANMKKEKNLEFILDEGSSHANQSRT